MSIPPQKTPLLPQKTTHFTLGSLRALPTVSVMPSLTILLCDKRIQVVIKGLILQRCMVKPLKALLLQLFHSNKKKKGWGNKVPRGIENQQMCIIQSVTYIIYGICFCQTGQRCFSFNTTAEEPFSKSHSITSRSGFIYIQKMALVAVKVIFFYLMLRH